jgi:hypothetical protein
MCNGVVNKNALTFFKDVFFIIISYTLVVIFVNICFCLIVLNSLIYIYIALLKIILTYFNLQILKIRK